MSAGGPERAGVAPDRQRRSRAARARARGAVVTETVVILGLVGLGAAAAFVTAGARLHTEYREHRANLASPYP